MNEDEKAKHLASKMATFGILYGMGAQRLAAITIPREQIWPEIKTEAEKLFDLIPQ